MDLLENGLLRKHTDNELLNVIQDLMLIDISWHKD